MGDKKVNKNQVMKQVLKLARNGIGFVKTNPLVGCIITDKNGNIIGKGYHEKYGENHAEINAIQDVIKNGHSLRDAILYVNLEPCSHFGKTPPCVDAIIKSGIKKVIIGHKDQNPIINGLGIEKLKLSGIQVETEILKNECIELNKAFIINKIYNRPYIVIKSATTLDGRIADSEGNSKWITSEKSRRYVHRLRYSSDAILTTAKTILQDNPLLNARIGKKEYKKILIIIDTNLDILKNKELNIFKTAKRIILLHNSNINLEKDENIDFIRCEVDNNKNLIIEKAFNIIYEKFLISSIITECGGKTLSYLIENNIFDELNLFLAPIISSSNGRLMFNFIKSVNIADWSKLTLHHTKKFDSDIMLNYRRKDHK
jgi:diaminohydroxyphosphoribosylaminopyrimidine deaminase/5-amino-6-(5-phosphoribosylamino)uracil reductase